jgi:hypothetical protein
LPYLTVWSLHFHNTGSYRQRNWVERLFVKAKQFRWVAVWYDKIKATCR